MAKSNTNLNKKGNLTDYLEVGKFFLVVIFLGFFIYTLFSQTSTTIDQNNMSEDNYTSFIEDTRDKVVTSLDWVSIVFLIIALIFSVIMAKKVPVNRVFSVIAIFISFVFFIISFAISNIFGKIMDNGEMATFINLQMPITKILLRYFPFVTAIYIAVVLIVFFSKDE